MVDTYLQITLLESLSRSMADTISFTLAVQFYASELWHKLFDSRAFILTVFMLTFTICSRIIGRSKGAPEKGELWRRPRTYPFSVPIIGHFLMMGWDSQKFISAVGSVTYRPRRVYWKIADILNPRNRCRNAPTLLKLLVTDMYVISGPENVTALWKQPDLHTRIYRSLSFATMCKMPKDALAFWMADDSGMLVRPHPDSNVPAHLRVDYMTHDSVAKLLTGVGLKPSCDRFTRNLSQRLLANTSVSSEWVDHPDLFQFFQYELFPAAVEAMWGNGIFSVNPDFLKDMWAFSRGLPYLAKGYPRWLVPSAYRARDKCLESVKRWHRTISPILKTPARGMEQWTPEYGAEFVKYRHHMWSRMPRMGTEAVAGEDLGMIWA